MVAVLLLPPEVVASEQLRIRSVAWDAARVKATVASADERDARDELQRTVEEDPSLTGTLRDLPADWVSEWVEDEELRPLALAN